MKKILLSLLDLIYKKKCYFCSSSKSSLKMCPKCYEELSFAKFQPNRIVEGVNVYSCGIYEKTLQKLIRGLKYHKQKSLPDIWHNLCTNTGTALATREVFRWFLCLCIKTGLENVSITIWNLQQKNSAN